MSPDPVPFVDLALQHRRIADEAAAAIREVIDRAQYTLGPDVADFESEFAAFSGVAHAVGVASGTDALELALRAAGVQPGDEVIIPVNTFVATAEAVVRAGGHVVVADCTPDHLIDPGSAARARTTRTRAVVGVHLYGQMAPMETLEAHLPGVTLVEDAAQSQGATRHGRPSGSWGLVAGTSFYPGKNLGAFGDGGAVLTDDDALAETARALRNHGGIRKYEHRLIGTTSRLDTIQAAVLRIRLKGLDADNAERELAARRYAELLRDVDGVDLPQVAAGNTHVWHLFVVGVDQRDRVQAALADAGVGCGIHYPLPIHRLPAFADRVTVAPGGVTQAEAGAERILSLPMFPGITPDQQERVADVLRRAVAR